MSLIFGRQMGDVACAWRVSYSPSRNAFSIWGLIFAWLLASVIEQLMVSLGFDSAYAASSWNNMLAGVGLAAAGCWVVVFGCSRHEGRRAGLVISALFLLASTSCAVGASVLECSWRGVDPLRVLFVGVPFSLFAGWMCVASALGHCHAHETVVRNVTPETIRLTPAAWPVLTDFEFAKQVGARGRTYTLCGRADYLPPEMVLNRGCGPGYDWWGLGILTYEMIAGVPPFAPFDGVATHAETYRRILRGKPRFFPPVLWAEGGKQFVAGLLVQRPEARLGSKPGGGVAQVAASKFLQRVDFERLARPENPLQAPFVPHVAADDDTSNYDPYPDSDEPMPVVWNHRMTGEDPFKGIGFD